MPSVKVMTPAAFQVPMRNWVPETHHPKPLPSLHTILVTQPMQSILSHISQHVEALPPITLDEMKSIRLMNRTDQKYLTNLSTLDRLLQMVEGKYRAQVVNGKRICGYATTYFDQEGNHSMFRQHETGHKPRTKVRVRTYLESDLTFLEVKKKDNHGKTAKTRIQVPSLDAVTKQGEGADFVDQATGLDLKNLHPVVSNRFKRITLVNMDMTERLTIDFDIRFKCHASGEECTMDQVVVIELKRDGRAPSPILPILRQLRIKPSGFSKYCIGASVTGAQPRINRFKKRLVKIRKVADKA